MAIGLLGSHGAGYLSTSLYLGVEPSVTPKIMSGILTSSDKTQDQMHVTSSAWDELEQLKDRSMFRKREPF